MIRKWTSKSNRVITKVNHFKDCVQCFRWRLATIYCFLNSDVREFVHYFLLIIEDTQLDCYICILRNKYGRHQLVGGISVEQSARVSHASFRDRSTCSLSRISVYIDENYSPPNCETYLWNELDVGRIKWFLVLI